MEFMNNLLKKDFPILDKFIYFYLLPGLYNANPYAFICLADVNIIKPMRDLFFYSTNNQLLFIRRHIPT